MNWTNCGKLVKSDSLLNRFVTLQSGDEQWC